MSGCCVTGLGEILWDLLPDGRVMGGAPANFAFHAAQLGAESQVITRIGMDADGVALREQLRSLDLPTRLLQVDPAHPTGTVTVRMRPGAQHEFIIHEGVAWDFLEATAEARAAVRECDVICFGSLAQRHEVSRAAIQALVAEVPKEALRVLDVNLRQHFYTGDTLRRSLELSNALKLNETELPVLKRELGLKGDQHVAVLQELGEAYDLRFVAFTRGGAGSVIWTPRRISEHPGVPTPVVDTIGAGDAFTAALATGWFAGLDLDEIHDRANRLGSFVCSQKGATPRHPN